MAETVETLTVKIEQLRAEFESFKALTMPVVEAHQPTPPEVKLMPIPPRQFRIE